jgi:integrase
MVARSTSGLKSWEHPKGSGIRIREVLNAHGGEVFGGSFLVTVPAKLTGRLRERKQFASKGDAETWAGQQYWGHRKQGEDFFALTDDERREVGAIMPTLRKHGVSLSEAVRFAIKHLRPEGRGKTVRQVVAELTASKTQRFERGDLRERSYQDFCQRAARLADGLGGRIASEVSAQDIKAWVAGMDNGVRSNKNYLAIIGEVFKFAAQKRYVAFTPLDHLTDVDRKEICGGAIHAREPSILTPAEAERLLNAALAHPDLDLLGAITLALFCGLRTEEIKRLEWKHVRLTESPPVITIGAKIAKKRRIRHVDIPANALGWLSLVPGRKGQVTRSEHTNDYQLRFRELLGHAKFTDWEANAMRHSFGSYHYALHGNPLETSRQLGHKASDQVLFDHYRALATKEQAQAYFAITPPACAAKVVNFQ